MTNEARDGLCRETMDTSETTNAWPNHDVSNATFGSMFDAHNVWRHGEILYIGYRSAFQEEDARTGNPHAKRLRLVALDIKIKQTVWQETFTFAVEGMKVYTDTMSELRVEYDTVYLFTNMFNGASGSWLAAFDAATGRRLWSRTGVLSAAYGNVAVCQGRVFLCGFLRRAGRHPQVANQGGWTSLRTQF